VPHISLGKLGHVNCVVYHRVSIFIGEDKKLPDISSALINSFVVIASLYLYLQVRVRILHVNHCVAGDIVCNGFQFNLQGKVNSRDLMIEVGTHVPNWPLTLDNCLRC
jgi:hypothetical protein